MFLLVMYVCLWLRGVFLLRMFSLSPACSPPYGSMAFVFVYVFFVLTRPTALLLYYLFMCLRCACYQTNPPAQCVLYLVYVLPSLYLVQYPVLRLRVCVCSLLPSQVCDSDDGVCQVAIPAKFSLLSTFRCSFCCWWFGVCFFGLFLVVDVQ